jgi:hypothetical protein
MARDHREQPKTVTIRSVSCLDVKSSTGADLGDHI